jgi:hypothetical protein
MVAAVAAACDPDALARGFGEFLDHGAVMACCPELSSMAAARSASAWA